MGPVVVIELAEPVPSAAVERLRVSLARLSSRCRQTRYGEYDLHVPVDRLGITGPDRTEDDRPFLVSLIGPGIADEEIFEDQHAEEPWLSDLIGFAPTHCVSVVALCGSRVDRTASALLAAAVMDVLGGVAAVELRHPDELPAAASCAGVLATVAEPWPTVYGTTEFLRTWAGPIEPSTEMGRCAGRKR